MGGYVPHALLAVTSTRLLFKFLQLSGSGLPTLRQTLVGAGPLLGFEHSGISMCTAVLDSQSEQNTPCQSGTHGAHAEGQPADPVSTRS